MKALQLLILFSIIVLSFTTCKKHPEGGWSNVAIKHLFGKNSSYAHKTWRLKKYEVNNIDSTIYITPGNGYTSFENDMYTFQMSGKTGLKSFYANTTLYTMGISFINKRRSLSIGVGKNPGVLLNTQCNISTCERNIFDPFDERKEIIWKIIKLETDELIITTTQNNNNYKISLVN